MNRTAARSLQKSVRDWISIDHWNAPYAVTLTFKQRIRVHDGMRRVSVSLTPELAVQNFRHFMNLLNKRMYGNAARRHGKRLPVFPVHEGGGSKRLHYHAMIDCPRDDLRDTFPALIDEIWRSTQWGYYQTKVTAADEGWITYVTKLRDKPDLASAIDWMNYHNPGSPSQIVRDCRV